MSKHEGKTVNYYEKNRIKAKRQRQHGGTEPETEVILCKSGGPEWYRKYAAHVLDSRAFLMIYVVGFLAIFLIGVAILVAFQSSAWTEETTQAMEIAFNHYADDGVFCLYPATEETPFYVYCNNEQTKQWLMAGCSNMVPYKIRTEKHGNPVRYYDVAEILDMNGACIISMEESNQVQEQENRHIRTVLLAADEGLLLLWACFTIASIAVGCAPERHRRLARLLYRSGSIVYFDLDEGTVQ